MATAGLGISILYLQDIDKNNLGPNFLKNYQIKRFSAFDFLKSESRKKILFFIVFSQPIKTSILFYVCGLLTTVAAVTHLSCGAVRPLLKGLFDGVASSEVAFYATEGVQCCGNDVDPVLNDVVLQTG